MTKEMADRIYEAALLPELWIEALQDLAASIGSVAGQLMIAGENATPVVHAPPFMQEVIASLDIQLAIAASIRPALVLATNPYGFVRETDYLSAEQIAIDPISMFLAEAGLSCMAETLVPLPIGGMVSFTFSKALDAPVADAQALSMLDEMRPHLARSALLSARLGTERARATLSTLQALGLPAAVLRFDGRVVASNTKFEAYQEVFRSAAFDRLALSDPEAGRLFKQGLEGLRTSGRKAPLSIPVRRRENAPMVLHLLPICRNVHDLFAGCDVIFIVSEVSSSSLAPDPALLSALFDLTPAQANLAGLLTGGNSLKEAAKELGVSFQTARSHLSATFQKTGTNRQSDLVALLKSARPLQ